MPDIDHESTAERPAPDPASAPFAEFARDIPSQSRLRAAIAHAERLPEPVLLPPLLAAAQLPDALGGPARELARRLVEALRRKPGRGLVEALIQEFSLSSQEGVALMCLAEALLRIPDTPTRDALIRDKIGKGDWQAHAGSAPSLFIHAATWGLMITGKLVATSNEASLANALTRLIARGGEPLIRKGLDIGMRLMGEQFVSGETIAKALANGRRYEARGFSYSFDMLGEAATVDEDARRYCAAYEQAIHAIGRASAGRGICEGPGISIKLSALHPRYSRAQRGRVLAELLPRLRGLAVLARGYDIGFSIDAEEADRLGISLDLLEALSFDPALDGWHGLGFVVQAYLKPAPLVLDCVIDLARRSRRRLMLRLVKGAYWDAEIKRAQVAGMDGYSVYTRKIYTDVAYLACAKKLLAAPDAIYPQFATHNALTLASIYHLAGPEFRSGQYEFQCLHGMGEPLYEEVVGRVTEGRLDRPCRIYAPVGTHETLLAYLVRRLLENGSNTSFVNRIADPAVNIDALIGDPVEEAGRIAPVGAPHPRIPLPRDLFGRDRVNSAGLDLANEGALASLAATLAASARRPWHAAPMLAQQEIADRAWLDIRNPANHRDLVGRVIEAHTLDAEAALAHAARAAPLWRATPAAKRAACLERAADLAEARMPFLLGLLVREAGKSLVGAVAEVREAVDFLRYYAAQVRRDFDNATHVPLGPVVCISPWNFPLAIFMGQVGAALAAGNPVVAKPAEQTPLVAAEAVRILRSAGVPADVVQLLPGRGETVGAALVGNPHAKGVLFTGSTDVAREIARALAQRMGRTGEYTNQPIPLIAETGGQNAMIVDSSALVEQVVHDVLQSCFDSAGQRCSALRVLCLQEDIAVRMLDMLQGAMRELVVGNPDVLATDVGPVIDAPARDALERHVAAMRAQGFAVHRIPLPAGCEGGTFVAPTIVEIPTVRALTHEVFGPVLHVVRFRRDQLDALLADIRATGYGLTFGVHSRIDETIDRAIAGARAGNIYINRNMVGAVVGVQPFGGEGLSGTGPKAGGPLYLRRLLERCPPLARAEGAEPPIANALFVDYCAWLAAKGEVKAAQRCTRYLDCTPAQAAFLLPGPTGELNTYELRPRGHVLCHAQTRLGALVQLGVTLATGNVACFAETSAAMTLGPELPPAIRARTRSAREVLQDPAVAFEAALFEGELPAAAAWCRQLAQHAGPIVRPQCATPAEVADGTAGYELERLVAERSVSVNTTAAGGNATLMTIG
jgi:RHH-type proline utilization regulon transcriptional repressor/proline dehydrogenase/delta 1-pyrroline-5-carboxylate dehydrogenase